MPDNRGLMGHGLGKSFKRRPVLRDVSVSLQRGEVVGLSNVFVPEPGAATYWAECVGMLLDLFPGLPIVGYESGAELALAQTLGFEALHPLRVWQTLRP